MPTIEPSWLKESPDNHSRSKLPSAAQRQTGSLLTDSPPKEGGGPFAANIGESPARFAVRGARLAERF